MRKRPGPKPLPRASVRVKSVHVKFRQAEYEAMKQCADAEHRSVASLVRDVMLSANRLSGLAS